MASIRPAALNNTTPREGAPDAGIPSLRNAQPGRNLTIANQGLRSLIALAYDVGGAQVVAPQWEGDSEWQTNHFDIVAKVPSDGTKEQLPLMLQSLLADRFKLALHRETRPTSVYVMEISRGGAKLQLQESPADDRRAPGCERSWGRNSNELVADCHGLTAAGMAQSIQTLAPAYFDRPLLDATDLKGIYSFSLRWITRSASQAGMDGATMFEAVANIGLKINTRKQPMEMLVIDHCEKMPTEN